MMGRRTRAKTAQATASAIASTKKLDVIDQNFASPKRKDCKLDTNSSVSSNIVLNGHSSKSLSPSSSPPLSPPPVNTAVTNGKRNHKNAGGSRAKKSPHQITKYFHTNGQHSDHNESIENCSTKSDGSVTPQSDVGERNNDDDNIAMANGDVNENENSNVNAAASATAIADVQKTPAPMQNGCVLMSPEAKSLQNSAVKQTTPHRIVVRSSPSKKQRLYVKDPVEVFSNLNIRDGATKNGGKKGKQTRRKLSVHDSVENRQNGFTNARMPTNDTETESNAIYNVDDDDDDVDDGDRSITTRKTEKLPTSKSNVAATGKNTKNNVDKTFAVPINPPSTQRRIQSTQLTDYFPIRRSGRKTKKAVEQEISQYIEMAIEKQLEDGLIVKVFAEKGRGIVAGRPFQRGEFVVEYIGELIDQLEADRREEAYAENAEFGCYMYYFKHKEQQWCIDATAETGKLGRLVNHSRNGNLMTKIVSYKNKPHLVLLAKDDIEEGEELTYDYGDRRKEALIHHPWLAF